MGRALFSQTYSSPAVRTEPEPGLVSCEKWSRCNPFDPDSDEFFNDAEYEAFVDPVDYRVVASERSGSPAFSDDSSSSERASSPIASPDDPQPPVIVAGWEQRILTGATEWRQNSDPSALLALFGPRAQRAAADDPAPRPPRNRTRSATVSSLPSFLPPSSLRNSTTATDITTAPSFRRTVNITPIDIPVPSDPAPPDTPSYPSLPLIIPPSPTTRIYIQNRLALTQTPAPVNGPLTNPRARMSLPRITVAPPAPTPVRIQNAVV